MKWYQNLGLRSKILLVVSMACCICALSAMGVARFISDKEHAEGLAEKATTILLRMDAVAKFVAKQGGLKSVIKEMTSKYKDPSEISDEDRIAILNQVPIYGAMKIASDGAKEDHYHFRVFSDEPRRKENLATKEELEIFNQFREDQKLEFLKVNDGKNVIVYRPVRLHSQHGCMTCHGNPDNSPWGNGKDILGYKMENWSDGKLHGVFAVSSNIQETKMLQAKAEIMGTDVEIGLFIGLGGILSLLIAYILFRGTVSQFQNVAEILKESTEHVTSATEDVAQSSNELTESVNVQTAAIHETVASMAEMKSMIAKTSTSVDESMKLTSEVKEKTDEGLRNMQRMVSAMESIQQANVQLHNMANIISEISNKTQVINDIVFKTQLLSFNASIEAARAGIHGKGFAVVAEEVGNLAQLSGNAAKEIQSLLSDSQKQTNSIIEMTQERVEEAKSVSVEALNNFNQIAKEVDLINQAVQTINNATKEQEAGIEQTNLAMTQLDQSSQKNNNAAMHTSELSESLKNQSDILRKIQYSTSTLVFGENKSSGEHANSEKTSEFQNQDEESAA